MNKKIHFQILLFLLSLSCFLTVRAYEPELPAPYSGNATLLLKQNLENLKQQEAKCYVFLEPMPARYNVTFLRNGEVLGYYRYNRLIQNHVRYWQLRASAVNGYGLNYLTSDDHHDQEDFSNNTAFYEIMIDPNRRPHHAHQFGDHAEYQCVVQFDANQLGPDYPSRYVRYESNVWNTRNLALGAERFKLRNLGIEASLHESVGEMKGTFVECDLFQDQKRKHRTQLECYNVTIYVDGVAQAQFEVKESTPFPTILWHNLQNRTTPTSPQDRQLNIIRGAFASYPKFSAFLQSPHRETNFTVEVQCSLEFEMPPEGGKAVYFSGIVKRDPDAKPVPLGTIWGLDPLTP